VSERVIVKKEGGPLKTRICIFQRVVLPVCAPAVIVLLSACFSPGIDGVVRGGDDDGETAFTLLLPRLDQAATVVRAAAVPGRAILAYPPDAAILDGLDYTIDLIGVAGTRTIRSHGTASVSASAPAGPLQIDVRALLDGSPYASGSLAVEVKRNGSNEFMVPLYKDESGFLTVGGTITADYPAGPLAGAVVQLKQGPLLVGQAVTTDAAGKWSVDGVGPGDGYYIAVGKAGYNPGISAPFSVTGSGGGVDLSLAVVRVIDISVPMTGNATGPGWAYTHGDKTLTLHDGASLTVTGTATGGRRLSVASGAQNVTLALLNAVIDVSTEPNACALLVQSGSSLTLRLEGANVLKSGDNKAGIQTSGAEISITGNGALNVSGGGYGAGIGGSDSGEGGTIGISGGTITATGGYNAVGIGGGRSGNGGNIRISGGTITASGEAGGAGIGGGYGGTGGTIEISGGTINALGGMQGAGIGGGSSGGAGGTIRISGGTVNASGNTDSGAGIGGGNNGAGGTIEISGGTVSATGSNLGAAVGGSNNGAGADLTITGGTITAIASGTGSGTGSEKVFGGGFSSTNDGTLTITLTGSSTCTYWANSAASDPGGAGTSGIYTPNVNHKWVKIVCQ
jgi:hypothetical protein